LLFNDLLTLHKYSQVAITAVEMPSDQELVAEEPPIFDSIDPVSLIVRSSLVEAAVIISLVVVEHRKAETVD
jgi:hypothetical protein